MEYGDLRRHGGLKSGEIQSLRRKEMFYLIIGSFPTPGDVVLEQLEAEAGEERNRLWADPHPVPPREWRKKK
jgi:hypothetical protein